MTYEKAGARKKAGYCFSWLLIAVSAVLMIKAPDICRTAVTDGLIMCVRAVIPSVFPAAVIGSLVSRIEAPRFISKPISRLFGVSPAGAGAIITGMFSGFPTGAVCTVDLLRRGRISKEEAEKTVCIVSAPSPPFIVGTVGAYMLGSVRAGVILLVFSIALSFAAGVILNGTGNSVTSPSDGNIGSIGLRDITQAVKDAAFAVINVTAFIAAFSLICGYASAFFGNGMSTVVIKGVLEIGNGVGVLANSDMPVEARFILAGAFVGWTGMSAQMQVLTVCAESDIGMMKYFIGRIITALMMACLCALVTLLPFSVI